MASTSARPFTGQQHSGATSNANNNNATTVTAATTTTTTTTKDHSAVNNLNNNNNNSLHSNQNNVINNNMNTTTKNTTTAEDDLRTAFFLSQRELPSLPEISQHVWNKQNEKQLRSALIGACKRMPRNIEANFHLGLMYMRNGDFQSALKSFQLARELSVERYNHYQDSNCEPPPIFNQQVARVRSHCAQAAHLVALSMDRDKHTNILLKTQKELIASIKHDCSSPDIWNALGLLHLNENGNLGARDVFHTIRQTFPDYLDALNNVGVAELALGNEQAAIAYFQKVLLCDRQHVEALSNYGVVLLRHGMYDAAVRAFNAAVKGAPPDGNGLPFAWGGLAIAYSALGQMDTADLAARRAEASAVLSNRPKFSMLRASIYVRRVADAYKKGIPWDSYTTAFAGVSEKGQHDETGVDGTSDGDGESHQSGDSDGEADNEKQNQQHQQRESTTSPDKDIPSLPSSQSTQHAPVNVIPNPSVGQASNGGNVNDDRDRNRDHRFIPPAITENTAPATTTVENGDEADPRPAIDAAVLRLRALARELKSSSASTALGAALRIRHHCGSEDSSNRNFGAEAAERLVEALEMDHNDATAWVQLSLLQMGTGEYASAKDFSKQAVGRNSNVEAGWNALAVASQLNDDADHAEQAYRMAINVIKKNYNSKHDRWSRPSNPNSNVKDEEEVEKEVPNCGVDDNDSGEDEIRKESTKNTDANLKRSFARAKRKPKKSSTIRRLEFPLTEADGGEGSGDEDLNSTRKSKAETSEQTNGEIRKKSNTNADDMEIEAVTNKDEDARENNDEEDEEISQLNPAGKDALAAVYNNLGNLRRQEGKDFSEALSAYEKSLKVGGENAVVYNNLALLYISSEKFEDAGKMLDHALKLDPKLECAISNRLKLTALIQKRESSSDGGYEDFRAFASSFGRVDDMIVDDDDQDHAEEDNDNESTDSEDEVGDEEEDQGDHNDESMDDSDSREDVRERRRHRRFRSPDEDDDDDEDDDEDDDG